MAKNGYCILFFIRRNHNLLTYNEEKKEYFPHWLNNKLIRIPSQSITVQSGESLQTNDLLSVKNFYNKVLSETVVLVEPLQTDAVDSVKPLQIFAVEKKVKQLPTKKKVKHMPTRTMPSRNKSSSKDIIGIFNNVRSKFIIRKRT